MALEKEKVLEIAEKFFKLAGKYEILTDKHISEYGDLLLKTPASLKFGTYQGGLLEFIINYTMLAVKLNKELPEDNQTEINSLVKVCFLAQIGKMEIFDTSGPTFAYKKNLPNISMGARAAKFSLENGISLNDDEYSSLLSIEDTEKFYDNSTCKLIRFATNLTISNYGKQF
jgi:hypothetical protein